MKKRVGKVKLAGKPVGMIEETGTEVIVTYSAEWLARRFSMKPSNNSPSCVARLSTPSPLGAVPAGRVENRAVRTVPLLQRSGGE